MKKSQKNVFSIILFLALVFIITYTYIDNNRINIVQEEVVINNLPSEFSTSNFWKYIVFWPFAI